jgi:hypothetical protein
LKGGLTSAAAEMVTEFDHRLLTTHHYAIVDASQREIVPPHWQTQVIAPAFLKQDTLRCPVLVDLNSLSKADHDVWLMRTYTQMQRNEPLWFSVLLGCDVDIDSLLPHLRNRIALRLPEHDLPVQFRFYDPNTLTHLPRIFGQAGMAWLMRSVNVMTYVLPYTQARVLSSVKNPVMPEAKAPFCLDHVRQAELQALGVINRALVQLPLLQDEAAWRAKALRASTMLTRARQHGLTGVPDQVEFVLHGLTVHERFDDHPRIKALLVGLRHAKPEDDSDYRELSAQLTADDWRCIADEIAITTQSGSHYYLKDQQENT